MKARIQKVISELGVMSRRAAERAILADRIIVNGKPAVIGMQVDSANDIIEVDGERIQAQGPKKLYVMLNKPRGYVCSLQDGHGGRLAVDLLCGVEARVYNVGRLDKDSEGLLLFTNDGAFANKVMHPRNKVRKIYRVTVMPRMTEEQLIKLSSKILLDGVELVPAEIFVIKEGKDRSVLEVKVTQGKNRQIRRMCDLVGLEVVRLKRLALGDVKIGMLKPGGYRYLTAEEVESFEF